MPHYSEDYAEDVVAPQLPDPRHLMELATGYWASAVLLAANRLRLFPLLSKSPMTAAEVAARLGGTPRAAEIFLNACCGLDLLAKEDDRFRTTLAVDTYLVPDSPAYLGSAIEWASAQYEAWGRLDEALQTGNPVLDPEEHLGDDPARTRNFVLAMHERARSVAQGVIRFLDLDGASSLLDVGGGPGTYAMLLAGRYPALRATVLDLPAVTEVANELIAHEGLAERVHTVAGDATSGDYGEGAYDTVLFSGVLHQMSPGTIQRMLTGAHRALVPGGKVLISDIMLDVVKTQPTFATLFSVQMLLSSREGAVFSVEDCEVWLEKAGFASIVRQRLPEPLPYTVVSAIR